MSDPLARFLTWFRKPRSRSRRGLLWLIGAVLLVGLWPLALALYLLEQRNRGLVVSRLAPLLLAVLWVPYLSMLSPASDAVSERLAVSNAPTSQSTLESTPSTAASPQESAQVNENVADEDPAQTDSTPTTVVATSTSTASTVGASGEFATVVSVTDGDTIRVMIDGIEEPVRLIGLDAPEPGECVAAEATARLSELVGGSEVEVVRDQSERDQFGRLLRYLYVDGRFVNEILVVEGLAIARRYAPDTSMASTLESAQATAEAAQKGLWKPDACGLATDADLLIGTIHYDAAGNDNNNLNDEWVEIVNSGSAIDMTGWVLKDESASHRYSFRPGFQIDAGASIRVYTGCGTDTSAELYWCNQVSAVWNNSGDTVFLLDPSGNISVRKSY